MEKIMSRLAQYIDSKEVSRRQFEENAGVTNGIIQKAIRNATSFGINNLNKVAEYYPDLNLNWLFRGGEAMIVDNITQSTEGNYNQTNIQGNNTQTNYASEPPTEYKTEENEDSIIEFLKKQLEEKDRLIREQKEELKEQKEELKEYKDTVKKKDERIEVLTDKLISA